LKKVSVHEEGTIFTRLGHWSIRTHEAAWGFAGNFVNMVGFGGKYLIKVCEV
jgi:hypothetical protein